TREEWLAARLELLKAEKALTRRSDELAQWRQRLPWVRIDKEYQFVPVVGSIPTSYRMLNFTLNSLIMELVGGLVDAEVIDQLQYETIRNRIAMSIV
ncbi:MAG: DUF899 family protein, partial [Nitrososphaeraceae archaeon]